MKIKRGDFVTGIDRSYERSIYKVLSIHPCECCDHVMLILDFYRFGDYCPWHEKQQIWARPIKDFRLATESELKGEQIVYSRSSENRF